MLRGGIGEADQTEDNMNFESTCCVRHHAYSELQQELLITGVPRGEQVDERCQGE